MIFVHELTGYHIYMPDRTCPDLDLLDLLENEKRLVLAVHLRAPRELTRAPDETSLFNYAFVDAAICRQYESVVDDVHRDGAFVVWNCMWWKPEARRIVEYLRTTMASVAPPDYPLEYHVVFGRACGYDKVRIRSFLEAKNVPSLAIISAYNAGVRLFETLLMPATQK